MTSLYIVTDMTSQLVWVSHLLRHSTNVHTGLDMVGERVHLLHLVHPVRLLGQVVQGGQVVLEGPVVLSVLLQQQKGNDGYDTYLGSSCLLGVRDNVGG